jgi:hypothetical protein
LPSLDAFEETQTRTVSHSVQFSPKKLKKQIEDPVSDQKHRILSDSVDLPPIKKVNMRRIKLTSDEGEYSIDRIEE